MNSEARFLVLEFEQTEFHWYNSGPQIYFYLIQFRTHHIHLNNTNLILIFIYGPRGAV